MKVIRKRHQMRLPLWQRTRTRCVDRRSQCRALIHIKSSQFSTSHGKVQEDNPEGLCGKIAKSPLGSLKGVGRREKSLGTLNDRLRPAPMTSWLHPASCATCGDCIKTTSPRPSFWILPISCANPAGVLLWSPQGKKTRSKARMLQDLRLLRTTKQELKASGTASRFGPGN